jgi:hypothetical protein
VIFKPPTARRRRGCATLAKYRRTLPRDHRDGQEETMTTSTEPLTPQVGVLQSRLARYWSPAQLIVPAIGFVFTAWGLINLGHSGFHPERVFQPHDSLAGLHYTPLLAALEVGFGLFMLIGGGLLRAARTQIRTVNGLAIGLGIMIVTLAGAAALGLGIVVLADTWPTQLHHWLNTDHRDGVLFVVAGALALGAALTSPFILAPAESGGAAQPETAPTAPPEQEATTVIDASDPKPEAATVSDAPDPKPEATTVPDEPDPKAELAPAPDAR